MLKTTGLFIVTALAEIIGCYLPYFTTVRLRMHKFQIS